MENEKVVVATPFLSLLALLFIYLKLTDKIDWSWWWVLAPIWIPAGIVLGLVLFAVIVVLVLSWRR